MRLRILLLAAPFVVLALTPAKGDLLVDFGTTASGGSPVAAGMSNGNVANNPSSGAAPITYVNLAGLDTGGFGTASVEGVVTMSSGDIPSNTFRAVNRSAPAALIPERNPGLNNETANNDLLRDWIGITQSSTLVNDVITLNTSPKLTFTVSGLDPGKYVWTSWHHDIADQTGLINYTFSDALGVATGVIDASHGTNQVSTATPPSTSHASNTGLPPNTVNGRGLAVNGTGDPINNPPGTPTAFTHEFIVDGSGTFSFAMESGFDPSLMSSTENLPYVTTSLNFAFINGFQVARVPEPSTMGLIGSVAAFATLLLKRRK
jgi:hypothetical protein